MVARAGTPDSKFAPLVPPCENLTTSNGNFAMKKIVLLIIALTLNLPAVCLASQTAVGTPAKQYSTLLKEYGPAGGGMRTATTDAERKTAVEKLATFASKFIDLAEKYPNDPVALKALRQACQAVGSTDSAAINAWEINESNFPARSDDSSPGRTVALIMHDHLLSDKIGPIVDRMRYAYRVDYEPCLQAILEKNPHRDVQALTCLSLAQYLSDKLQMLNLSDDRTELGSCFEIVFGEQYLPEWRGRDRAKLEKRIEALFERAASEYSDVKFRGSTIGETAKSELYAIHNLGVGKMAPDIVGKDQDGTPLKLSDYRGKVVLLYFWSEF
jgi:hypothetical protein